MTGSITAKAEAVKRWKKKNPNQAKLYHRKTYERLRDAGYFRNRYAKLKILATDEPEQIPMTESQRKIMAILRGEFIPIDAQQPPKSTASDT